MDDLNQEETEDYIRKGFIFEESTGKWVPRSIDPSTKAQGSLPGKLEAGSKQPTDEEMEFYMQKGLVLEEISGRWVTPAIQERMARLRRQSDTPAPSPRSLAEQAFREISSPALDVALQTLDWPLYFEFALEVQRILLQKKQKALCVSEYRPVSKQPPKP